MIGKLFEGSSIPAMQELLAFTQARHELLAGNIANIDTPGYRTRDLNEEVFQERLKEALATANSTQEALSPGISDTRPSDPMREVRDSLNSVLYHDESNVSLENQVTQINKNQFMHNVAITVMRSQFQMLEAAISERV